MSVYTGEYFKHVSDDAFRAVYYTFTPNPLFDGDYYSLDEEICALLVETHRALGVLEGMAMFITDVEILKELMLLQECFYSRQIDYDDSDFNSLLENRGKDKDFSAIKKIMDAYRQSGKVKLDVSTLLDICSAALYGADSSEKANIRRKPLFITNAITNLRQYNPTAPNDILSALKDLMKYWGQDNSDILIKTALIHYQLEMIHPFDCYNGVIGRILISKALTNGGITVSCFLSPSMSLYYAKSDYFDILSSTQRSGRYVLWIKFFVRTMLDAARRAIQQVQNIQQITTEDTKKFKTHKASTENTLLVYNYFKRYLASGIPRASKVLRLSHETVSKAVLLLQEEGILRQTSIGSRNRIFVYPKLMNVLLEIGLGR